MTQETAAAAGGFEIRQWQRIERGETNITLAVLLRLAHALEIAPRSLMPDGLWVRGRSAPAGD